MIRRPPRSPLFPSTTLFRSQLDEPLFAVGGITREEVEAAIEANNQCWDGVTAFKWEHVCQGNYAVGEDYDGQTGHRYFDIEPYPTEQICNLECRSEERRVGKARRSRWSPYP